jgi:hypothetical protein
LSVHWLPMQEGRRRTGMRAKRLAPSPPRYGVLA